MNPPRSFCFPGWDILTQALTKLCVTPAGKQRAQSLQPLFNRQDLENLQCQHREMRILLSNLPHPLESLGSPTVHTLLERLQTPQALLHPSWLQAWHILVSCLHTLLMQIQALHTQIPLLWHWLQPLKFPQDLLSLTEPSLSQEKRQRIIRQRWPYLQTLVRRLTELDLLQARCRLGQSWQGHLAQFNCHEIQLQQWRFPLDLLQGRSVDAGDLHWPSHCHLWILTGRHGSGKTRLLQNLGLTVLMHQAGIAIPSAADACLPLFSSVHYLPEDCPLAQQLQILHEILKHPQTYPLLLLDNPLTQSNPSESYVLLRSLIRSLASRTGKTLVVTHHKLLGQLAQELPTVEKRALMVQGAGWQVVAHQLADSELLALARRNGWPHDLLKQAETELKRLKPMPSSHPLAPARAIPSPPQVPHVTPHQPLTLSPGVKPGVWIYFETYKAYGELLTLPDNKGQVWILLDNKKYQVDARHVLLSSHRKEKRGDTTGIRIVTQSTPTNTCDLHGMRVDDALDILEKFLDTASYAGLSQVTINHGKGQGRLRQAVHAYLKSSPYVRNFRLADYGQGDSGVTQVELR